MARSPDYPIADHPITRSPDHPLAITDGPIRRSPIVDRRYLRRSPITDRR
jgi:hypothetical protein